MTPTTLPYRGWSIHHHVGGWHAIGPNYDASYEGPEDGWVDNGEKVDALFLVALYEEIDTWIEEHSK